jgi:hypothetical protein
MKHSKPYTGGRDVQKLTEIMLPVKGRGKKGFGVGRNHAKNVRAPMPSKQKYASTEHWRPIVGLPSWRKK